MGHHYAQNGQLKEEKPTRDFSPSFPMPTERDKTRRRWETTETYNMWDTGPARHLSLLLLLLLHPAGNTQSAGGRFLRHGAIMDQDTEEISIDRPGKIMGSSNVQVDKDGQIPVYESGAEVLEVLQGKWRGKAQQWAVRAMYSSVVGGIILDPAMMVIPMDDHMVHRGHGVFDTAMIMDGCLYELDAHLDRFLRSAAAARIQIQIQSWTHDRLRAVLLQMTAASGCRRGSIRYWLSSGPGDFLLSSKGCAAGPAFYGVVIADEYGQCRHGVRAVTTSVPMKPPQFATMKNVNYLPNVLSIMDAEDRGAFASVWVDDQGFVAEGPMVNVAFVTPERELVLPPFDKILGGCTAKRMLALAPKLVGTLLTGVSNRHITVDEARRSVEMAFVGSGLPVLPIVEWDDQTIGDGKVGPLMLALSDLLWEDMKAGPDRTPVPYPNPTNN